MKLEEKIFQLKAEITTLLTELKEKKANLISLNSDKSTLLLQYANDIESFPPDFKVRLNKVEKEISLVQKYIKKIELKLYGYLTHGKEGLFWKYQRLTDKFKRQKIKSKIRAQEIQEESTEAVNEKLKAKVNKYLDHHGIIVTDDELVEILLDILGGIIDRHQEVWFDDKEMIEDEEIQRVLKERYSAKVMDLPVSPVFELTKKESFSLEEEIDASLKPIISKAQELIAENSKGVKAFLQEELGELIQKYIDESNLTYSSLSKKDFVRHYIWGYIIRLARYKNFDTFYNNIFQK